ncbi:MAG: hypothetical protein AB7N54_10250 [Alphaproteobacteria bacterium]
MIRWKMALAAAALAWAQPATAQDTISLKVISGYPLRASWLQAFNETFIPTVDEILARTGRYRIAWNEAYGGKEVQPGAELEGVRSGLGDAGLVFTAFHPDKLPLHKLTFVARFVTDDMDLMLRTMNDLERSEPAFQQLWQEVNLTNLVVIGSSSQYFILSRQSLHTLADLKGKLIVGTLPTLGAIHASGATAQLTRDVRTIYSTLMADKADGVMFWGNSIRPFNLCKAAPYILDTGFGPDQGNAITFNRDAWLNLPDEVRLALLAAAPGYSEANTALLTRETKTALNLCSSEHSAKPHRISEEGKRAWAMAMDNEAVKWADDLEKGGIPAKTILTRYMDAMRAANQPIARHWDRE